MPTMFAVLKLRDGTSAAEYERWVVETDVRAALSIPAVSDYGVYRITESLDGEPAQYDYVERIEITDIDTFRENLDDEEIQAAGAELGKFVEARFLLGEKITK